MRTIPCQTQEFGIGYYYNPDEVVSVVGSLSEQVTYTKVRKPPDWRVTRVKLLAAIPDESLSEGLRILVVATREAWVSLNALYDDGKARRKTDDWQSNFKLLYYDYRSKLRSLADAIQSHMPELLALHEQLYPNCSFGGITIFTRRDDKDEWY